MHCFLTEPPKMLKLQIIASCISAKSKQQRSVMSKINSILMCFRKQKQSWETKKTITSQALLFYQLQVAETPLAFQNLTLF